MPEHKLITAIIPGSFDPITVGHVNIIERASKLFDKIFVAIMVNTEKDPSHMFTLEERKEMAVASCAHIKNVEVITSDSLLAGLAKTLGATVLVKGARNATDFDYERTLARINNSLDPNLETVILTSAPALSHISSSVAREFIKYSCSLDGIVPEAALGIIRRK